MKNPTNSRLIRRKVAKKIYYPIKIEYKPQTKGYYVRNDGTIVITNLQDYQDEMLNMKVSGL